jgi:integrase
MAAAPRLPKNRSLPENLRMRRDGYYSYVNPLDGKEYGLGRDKAAACAEARVVNNHIAQVRKQTGLLDKITGAAGKVLSMWLDEYLVIIEKKDYAAATLRNKKYMAATIREGLGGEVIDRITTRKVADFIKRWTDKGKDQQAKLLRGALMDVFSEAHAAGWISSNPVAITRKPITKQTQRERLSLELFKAIYALSSKAEPWVARSLELAIVTGQRREDISNAKFSDFHDGYWWLVPQKTKKRGVMLKIPLTLRLNAAGITLGDTVKKCRDLTVSKYLIHHAKANNKTLPGQKVLGGTISRLFSELRDKTGMEMDNPPSLHECRSLAARLYTAQNGADFAQALLGHKNAKTTELYRDVRGSEWMEIKAG